MSFLTNLRAGRLIAEIRSSPDRTRPATRRAIARLKQIGPDAIDPVLTALADAATDAKMALVEVLGALVNERTFPVFVRGLRRGNPRVVSGISWALTGARNYPAFLLLEALATPGVAKSAVLEVISAQKARFTVRELLQAAYTQEPTEKAALFRIVGEIADASALPELLGQLKSVDTIARVHTINLLSRFNLPEIRKTLEALLTDPSKLIRGAVLGALQRMDPINIESVTALLRDREIDVQSRAVDLLIKAKRPDTVPHLVEVLKDERADARRAAVDVLNEVGDAASVKVLLEALKDCDRHVRGRAADALGKIGSETVIQSVLQLVHDQDQGIRRVAIEVLRHAQNETAVDALIRATRDPDSWARERAVEALAEIGSKKPLPRLLEMLRTATPQTLPVVVKALGRLGDDELVDTLWPLLSRPEREVRIEAIQALASVVDDDRTELLLKELKPLVTLPDTAIARAASAAIALIESRSARVKVTGSVKVMAGGTPTGGARAPIRRPGRRSQPTAPAAPVPQVPTPVRSLPPGWLDIQRLRPGDVLEGRYRYIDRIGRGAFGTVLLTEDTVVGEQLILKFLNPRLATDEEVMRRFVHELRYSRRISHENVIRIYDFHYIQGNYAIAMEYFPSHTLGSELVAEKPLELSRALKLAIDICKGMAAAHQEGIVHRDLKPANVLINDEGLLKIVDFGVAAAREGASDLTRPGFVIGSPKYMAPEQILGKKVDERADIYALGVMLYEMTTGVPPYSGPDHMSIMYQHVQGKARLPHEVNPSLPAHLSELIMQTMAVDKLRRFQSMQDVRLALQRHC